MESCVIEKSGYIRFIFGIKATTDMPIIANVPDGTRFGTSDLKSAAAAMGRKGGSVKSPQKTAAVRENAKRPRPGRTAKPFTHVVVITRSAPFGEIGDIVSRHTSQELAEKAARKSGYDEFLKIEEINTP